jgi:hypothetical protein
MSQRISRRLFLGATAAAACCGSLGKSLAAAAEQQAHESGYFTLAQRSGRWWFVTPEGEPFFSIALNHIDPSPLRYLTNAGLWDQKYVNSMERWLKGAVAPDLRAWGFNSVGWTQEVVTRGPTNHRHSRAFTFEEYQWLSTPYCHQLPFADFHQWDAEVRHPDFSSPEFAEWCDYVAREHCARMKDDPKLIGYFYIDCPTWIHTTQFNGWKGPLFDSLRLETEAGRKELFELATIYYRITHDAIRRYDQNHLILGDRYEASRPIAAEVIEAAKPYVDVLSFQHFSSPEKVAENLDFWHQKTGKPVLLADHAVSLKLPDGGLRHDGEGYAETLRRLRDVLGCVGYHLCGAYLRNECRRRALRDAEENPDEEAIGAITQANREAAEWLRGSER